MEAIIQFLNYRLDEVKFKIKKSKDKNFQIGYNFNLHKGGGEVILETILVEEDFELFLRIIGSFATKGNMDESSREQMFAINGTSILYPYLRSSISSITLTSLNRAVVIPTINIVEALGMGTKNLNIKN